MRFSEEDLQALGPALLKIASELTPAGREHIKAKNFALSAKQSDTGKPAYPIHDKEHAANALARVKQFGSPSEKSEVYKDVARKFPELAARSDVSAVRGRVKEAAAEKKEKRRPWNVANVRSGKRPMSVDTLLKKEKDGSLNVKLGEALLKIAQFYGPILPFTDSTDKGASPLPKTRADGIPSREEVDAQTPKREDGRSFTVTEMAPGTNLNEMAVTNSPQERTASAVLPFRY